MSLLKRFGFYGFGFAIGIFLLVFFLNGKKAACHYLPNDRMLYKMKNKPHFYTTSALTSLHNENMDTTDINRIFDLGDINFSKSKVHIKPCRYYWIDATIKDKKLSVVVENCINKAIFKNIEFYKK